MKNLAGILIGWPIALFLLGILYLFLFDAGYEKVLAFLAFLIIFGGISIIVGITLLIIVWKRKKNRK